MSSNLNTAFGHQYNELQHHNLEMAAELDRSWPPVADEVDYSDENSDSEVRSFDDRTLGTLVMAS